ncbi:glycosyltransferase family 2 protein [Candidatus Woesearchaeota archaeon]|nr:glycosyltransferase family 2 protein [Candidatus Woesearchaeota archaeon]
MDTAIIIPACNEEKTIAEVIAKTKNYCQNIIVVDDGSTDATSPIAKRTGVAVLRHKVNLGKGAALKTGCEYALQQGAEGMVVLDADGQHDPAEIPKFLEALKENDIVFGYRQVPETMPLVLRFGNAVINRSLRLFYNVHVCDSQCGYRAFTAAAYRQLQWEARDYYVETEMILNAGRKKLKHASIPIQTIYADKYKGTTVLDGIGIVAKILGGKLW